MKGARILVTSIVLFGFTACATSFQKPREDANYGEPPKNFVNVIKRYTREKLAYSKGTRFQFEQPVKAYENSGVLFGWKVSWKGYAVDALINRKSSGGMYMGFKPHTFLFTGNSVYRHYKGKTSLLHRLDN